LKHVDTNFTKMIEVPDIFTVTTPFPLKQQHEMSSFVFHNKQVKQCKDGEGASQESLYNLMSDGETHIA